MPKKLLIVDDELGICMSLRKYFIEKGHTVFFATEAGEALALLKEKRPQVVILDIKMPGLNGIEVLRLAKEIIPYVRVIIISAIKDEAVVQEAMRLGAYSYITKPFDLEQLDKLVG
jgi:DNA-binding NtrC family response regulator